MASDVNKVQPLLKSFFNIDTVEKTPSQNGLCARICHFVKQFFTETLPNFFRQEESVSQISAERVVTGEELQELIRNLEELGFC